MSRGDWREGRSRRRVLWGPGLVTAMLAAEFALSFARSIYFVSLGFSVIVIAAYLRRTATVAPREATVDSVADADMWSELAPRRSAPAPRRSAPAAARVGCLPVGVVALVVISAGLLAVDLIQEQEASHHLPPAQTPLSKALQLAASALPNDLQNYTITIRLDTRTGVWKLSDPVLLVQAGSRAHARFVARAMAATAWKAAGRALGSDGNEYLRFQVKASDSVIASLPSATNWNPVTTIPLDIPNSFPLGPNSQAVIDAPSGLVSATEPASSSESPLPTGTQDRIVVPITPDVQGLSVTLIGWVYRHPVVKFLGNEGLVVILPTGVVGSVFAWWRRKRRKGASTDHDPKPDKAADDSAAHPHPTAG